MSARKSRDIETLEHWHFVAFRKKLLDFPKGEVWHEDKPDFLIHAQSGIIGIEHCRVYVPSSSKTPQQAVAEWQDEVTRLAQKQAELQGLEPLRVSIFYGNAHMPKDQRLNIARSLADFVISNLPSTSGKLELDCYDHPVLQNYLDGIHVAKHDVFDNHHWLNPRAQWVLQDTQEAFQAEINKKAELHLSYLERCAECWLLMVSDASRPAQSIHPNEASLAHVYNSPFDRTYFFDIAMGNLHLLSTSS